MTDGKIFQKGFGIRDLIRDDLEADYGSRIMDWLRVNDYTLSSGRLTVRVAKAFGFCYGVERAVDYAYETVRMYPDRRVSLVGEIIHNPGVNDRLMEMGVTILPGDHIDDETAASLGPDDVVIIPAFGATVPLLERMQARGCILVDTTCGSVMSVWKRVRQYAQKGHTAIVHGKAQHEETRATCSQTLSLGGHYFVVLDVSEAEELAAFIRGEREAAELLRRFEGHYSDGFDPHRDLKRIGLANQTTMLSSESLAVAEVLRRAMAERYGDDEPAERFLSFDTICGATQDRQDAVQTLLESGPNLMVIVGGYNSSNTTHLVEIASSTVPTYFIQDARLIDSADRLSHFDIVTGSETVTMEWLPAGQVSIGVTAGASCPDSQIGDAILRLIEVTGASPPDFLANGANLNRSEP